MDVKKIMLIVVAVFVALGAAFAVNSMMRGSSAPSARAAASPQIMGPKIMVATRALPVGTILTADALRFQPWPEGLVKPDQYYVEGQADITNLAGSVVRVAMTAGAPITKGSLVNPRDRGFLAAALGPGMRAVTVPLSPDQGVAGFVFPGDRVDLIFTVKVNSDGGDFSAAETIVENLRVLGVDQRTAPTDAAGNSTPTVFQTVTLEATPQIAERIAVGRASGTLSLALRSIADNQGELEEAIASGTVSVPRDGDRTGEQRLLAGLRDRPSAVRRAPMTGGDISAFLPRRVVKIAPAEVAAMSPPGGSTPDYSAPPAGDVPQVSVGPTVRVVRGDQVTIVPVGGN